MSVKECSLKFTQLSKYVPHMVADLMPTMSKKNLGVSEMVVKECVQARSLIK